MNVLLRKLLGLAVKGSKSAWTVADGKKTIVGLGITAAGIGLMFVPGAQGYASDLILTGAPIMVTGIVHKIKKWKDKKKETQNA